MTLTVQLEEVEQDRQAGRMLEACIRADTAAPRCPHEVEGLRVGRGRGRHSWPCCPCQLTLPPSSIREVKSGSERRAGVESTMALYRIVGEAHGPPRASSGSRHPTTLCARSRAKTCNIQRSQRPGYCQTAPRLPPCRLRRVPHQPRPGGFFLGFWWERRNLEASPGSVLDSALSVRRAISNRSASHPVLAIGWAWSGGPADAR